MKLIVGLGNPGEQYANTRHNVGFMVLDYYADSTKLEFKKTKMGGEYIETIISGEKVILLKPQKFINLSGEVIIKFINYYKINLEDILIICDDLDFPVGKFKLRYKGSSTHNGLKNITQHLNSDEYKRLRIGISKNVDKSMVDYVIGNFNSKEKKIIKTVIETGANIVNDFVLLSFDNLMNKYN